VCANDASCTFHAKYICKPAKARWEHVSHQSHSCSWTRALHDKILGARKATDKLAAAVILKDTAVAANKASPSVATKKGVALAVEHLKLCKDHAKKTKSASASVSGTPAAPQTPQVVSSVWGLKPMMAAQMCQHMWAEGKEPKRSEIKSYLSTVMTTEPSDDFLRRVKSCSSEMHEEVCTAVVTCS
jgi:hypothetical protein